MIQLEKTANGYRSLPNTDYAELRELIDVLREHFDLASFSYGVYDIEGTIHIMKPLETWKGPSNG